MARKFIVSAMVVLLGIAGSRADDFGVGTNQFSMDFVPIGFAGNAADSTGYGAVDYAYRMGVYEVTVDQFSHAMAADDRISHVDNSTNHFDYSYWNNGDRSVGSGAPVDYISWYEAARFANWLTSGDAYAGAYQFDTNGVLVAVDRYSALYTYGTLYVIPTEDEWYKAAYYKPVGDGSYSDFANGAPDANPPPRSMTNGWNYAIWSWPSGLVVETLRDDPDYMWETGSGGQEQNGTYDMNGNSWDWCESAYDGDLDVMDEYRVIRGGGYFEPAYYMAASHRHGVQEPEKLHSEIGMRIVALDCPGYELNISVVGEGSVNLSNGWYDVNTNLSLTASPGSNWLFVGWSGDLSGDYTTASTNIVMDDNKSITAVFSDDADGDGLLNSEEGLIGTDPRDGDSDGDAMPDGWEVGYTLDPLVTNALDDADSDGGVDLYEFAVGGDPTNGLDVGYEPYFDATSL
ncbi:MAG: SUMF1/EgtB/PvdO family nonheme iron enzyme, partial [Pontiellaceae bacterium]|nr:SUMF1/EgtB/PvdO family nonheme iron enzyme [Pontiellaceae bacterium]MBN2783993.1 SUMF1/EgtB/PvdO family nonheme iron enzyme [Pontiellaceae bacterium]